MNTLLKIQELKGIIESINNTLKMDLKTWERKEWEYTLEYSQKELLQYENHVELNYSLF